MPIRRLTLAAVALVLFFAAVPTVSAHAQLVRSDPAYGAVLVTPPTAVRLWYSERVDPAFSSATIVAANGATIATPQPASRATDDPTELVLPLSPLAPGTYTVVWRAVSADDGHKTNGTIVFTVGPAPAASQAASGASGVATPTASQGASGATTVGTPFAATPTSLPPGTSPTLPPTSNDVSEEPTLFAVVIRWLELFGVALLIGAVFMGLVALRPLAVRAAPALNGLARMWRRTLRVALLCLGLGVAGTLLLQVATVSDQGMGQVFQPAVLVPLLASRWGILWALRVWCALLLVPLLVPAFWQLRSLPLVGALLVALPLLLSFSLMSHAAALQHGVVLAVATDAVHYAMASLWAGGLAMLLLLLVCTRRLPVEQRTPLTLQLVGMFSRVSVIAVGVLIATGTYSSLTQFTSTGELISTSYGRTLLLKLALAAVAFLLGGYHWLMARPQIATVAGRSGPARRLLDRLRGTIGLESGVAMLVLLAASGLVQTPPPADANMRGMVMAPTAGASSTPVPVVPTATVSTATPTPTASPVPTASPTAPPSATPTPSPFHGSVITGGLEIGLTLDTQAIGERQFTVTVKQSGAPVAADRVRLQVSKLDQELGTTLVELQPQQAGTYQARSPVLSLAGRWQVIVLVRRRGLEDVTASFPIDIP
ncbi:MAG: FixH family protein [Herpetosiphonaceae bacterium]|nr:FixH family protein [Herpetosiphonaceae bacterium]